MRVVHYLNQFFGGIGGKNKRACRLEVREGAVGPGLLLEQLLGDDAKVVMTLVCGDNYAVENQEEMIDVGSGKNSRGQAPICSSPVHAFKPAAMGWRRERSVLPCSRSSGFPLSPG